MTTDETTKTKQDSQSQTKAQADAEGSTQGGQPETFTKAQLDETVEKAVQKARIDAGRDAKSLETRDNALKAREAAIKASEQKIADWEKQQEEKALEDARDNPELLDALQLRKQLRADREKLNQDRQDLDREKLEHADNIRASEETILEINIWKVSSEYEGGDPVKLKDFCEKFNITEEEKIRDAADSLWTKKAPEDGTSALHVDSSKGSGGATDFTKVSFEPNAPSAREMISKGVNKK